MPMLAFQKLVKDPRTSKNISVVKPAPSEQKGSVRTLSLRLGHLKFIEQYITLQVLGKILQ